MINPGEKVAINTLIKESSTEYLIMWNTCCKKHLLGETDVRNKEFMEYWLETSEEELKWR